MNQRCIEQQTPPEIVPGDVVSEGEFFRNLKKEHVTKRYEEDDNENPVYGFKLHKKHWRYADRQGQGLSVNLQSCIHSEGCSIALHPDGENYFHVAVLDVKAINACGLLTSPLVAQYSPAVKTQNRCHFDIVPSDGTALKWMELGVLLDDPFPPAKLPSTKDEKIRAATAYAQYRSYCDIHRWVRREDGKLTL